LPLKDGAHEVEDLVPLADDGEPLPGQQRSLTIDDRNVKRARHVLWIILFSALLCALGPVLLGGTTEIEAAQPFNGNADTAISQAENVTPSARPPTFTEYLPVSVLTLVVFLMALSAFFASSETAFLSIPQPTLRGMREGKRLTGRLVTGLVDDPGRLLTTVLVGNMLVNTIIGVVLGTRLKDYLSAAGFPAFAAYITAIVVCTSVLLLFGEIMPKILAVRARESYACIVVIPLLAADWVLTPLRDGFLHLTDIIFRVTRFHELRAAPFITDAELKAILAQKQTTTTIQEDERQMIRRILEFHDVQLREILIPRPDIIALQEEATAAQALEIYREHEFSRIPVYRDDLDHITGVLFIKDLLPNVTKNELDIPVKQFTRPPRFVPETMSVDRFIKNVQRLRSHLAVVVDEYGGTEGIVTLHDAIEQVVGDIMDEDEEERVPYKQIAEGVYRVEGNFQLDQLTDLIGFPIEDQEHNTVSGFLMAQTEKILSVGDVIAHSGVLFTVEEVDGKRALRVRIETHPRKEKE